MTVPVVPNRSGAQRFDGLAPATGASRAACVRAFCCVGAIALALLVSCGSPGDGAAGGSEFGGTSGGSSGGVSATIRTQITTGAAPFTMFVEAGATRDGSRVREGGARFMWDFGDGASPIEGRTANHVYQQPGNYRITLRVDFEDGRRAFDRMDIRAVPRQTPAATAEAGGFGDWRESLPSLFQGYTRALGTQEFETIEAPPVRQGEPTVDDGGHSWISREIYRSLNSLNELSEQLRGLFVDMSVDAGVEVVQRTPVTLYLRSLHDGGMGDRSTVDRSGEHIADGAVESDSGAPAGLLLTRDRLAHIGSLSTAQGMLFLEIDVGYRALGVTPGTFSGRYWRCRGDFTARARLVNLASGTIVWYNAARWSSEFDVKNR